MPLMVTLGVIVRVIRAVVVFPSFRIVVVTLVVIGGGLILAVAKTAAESEATQYLCVVEQAAGLHYDNQAGAWRPQAFGTSRKYILRKLNEDDRDHQKGKWWSLFEGRPKAKWAFFEFGHDGVPKATCVELFDCQPLVSSASFDKDTGRFEMIYHGGYIDQGRWERLRQEDPKTHFPVDPSNPDDLSIEIGKCSPNAAAAAAILPNQTRPEPEAAVDATDVCATRCLPSGGLRAPPGGGFISRLAPSAEACLRACGEEIGRTGR
jgi:hypothetical protein